jgi:NTP pyrophosphatase (non-canonical NTP hydrolase)
VLSTALRKRLLKFRVERDWEQFHSPRTLSVALCVEAAELLEHFQWIGDADVKRQAVVHREEIAQEVADLAILLTYFAHDLGLNFETIVQRKLKINEQKYPIEKAKGSAKKYSEL